MKSKHKNKPQASQNLPMVKDAQRASAITEPAPRGGEKSKEILISVVIPCFNQEKNVRECLDSIFSQNFENYEVIAVDDKSSDNTLQILEEYQEKYKNLKVIKFDKNKGTSQARKDAVLQTAGKYVMFVDPDDLLEEFTFEKAFNAIETEQVDILQFGTRVVNKGVTEKAVIQSEKWNTPHDDKLFDEDVFFGAFRDNKYSFSLWGKIYDGDLVRKAYSYVADGYFPKAQDLYAYVIISFFAKSYSSISDKLYVYNFGAGLTGRLSISFDQFKIITSEIRIVEQLFRFIDTQPLQNFGEYVQVFETRINNFYGEISSYMPKVEDFDLYEDSAYIEFLENTLPKCKKEDFKNEKLYNIFTSCMYETIDRFVFDKKCDLIANKWIQQKIKNNEISDYPKTSRLLNRNVKYLDFKKNSKQIIPIVFATNQNYAPYVSVAIESLVENFSPDNLYDIYVFHTKLPRYTQRLLERNDKENVLVSCVNVSQKINSFGALYSYGHFSEEIYFRLAIAGILGEYEKVIYLDCDIVVLEDISKMFETNLQGNILGAVSDDLSSAGKKYVSSIDVDPDKYFNSGIIMINITEFANENIEEKFKERINVLKDYKWPDQDILNILCKDRVSYIDATWNTQLHMYKKFSQGIYQLNPKLIHYSGPTKPWNSTECAFSEHFWQYARKTPFYETILGTYYSAIKQFYQPPQIVQQVVTKKHGKLYRYTTWPFKMTKKFFVSLKKNGLKATLKKVKNKTKSIFAKLFKKKQKRKKFHLKEHNACLNPKVSVIIPVYNAEKYLKRCLNSILSQSFEDIEVICVNDGSTDNSEKILKKYQKKDNRIVILNQKNQYAGVARNNAMKIARGQYIMFLDSDDEFLEKAIEKAYKKATETNSDICLFMSNEVNLTTKKIKKNQYLYTNKMPQKDVFCARDIPSSIFSLQTGAPWGKIFNKEFVIKNNLQFLPIKRSEDFYFVDLALVKAKRITYLKESLHVRYKGIETSLESTKAETPTLFWYAYTQLANELKRLGFFEKYKRGFLINSTSGWYYNLNKASNYEMYEKMFLLLKTEGKNLLELDKHPDYYFYEQSEFSKKAYNFVYETYKAPDAKTAWEKFLSNSKN